MVDTIYFIYQHIRLDTSEIFYIGVGTKVLSSNTHRQKYVRAYAISGRNKFWKRVVNKSKYKIEIIKEFTNLKECLTEETRLIDLYGRLIIGTGILTNIVRDRQEVEDKRLKNLRISTQKRRIPVYKYSMQGDYLCKYESILSAASENNCLPTDICMCLKNRKYSCVNFQWKDYKSTKIDSYQEVRAKSRKITLRGESSIRRAVKQYDLDGNLIKIWASPKEAAVGINVRLSAIRNTLVKLSGSCMGFLWTYEDEERPVPIKDILEVFDLNNNSLGKFKTLVSAEEKLNIAKNTISVYMRKQSKHSKYIFKQL